MSWLFKEKIERIEVPISQCVHYCGFRYGHGEYHPYETYIHRLHKKELKELVRDQLIDFLLHYRPRHFGQALGLTLSREYPLWLFPWAARRSFWWIKKNSGWFNRPEDIPDIITHFSDAGIPFALLEQEFRWLESSYESICHQGYRPDLYGYPKGKLFFDRNNNLSCLLLDGNHRVSALSALGYSSLEIDVSLKDSVSICDIDRWAGVKNGFFLKEDSIKIFNAYFLGNKKYYNLESLPKIIRN